MRTDVLPDPPRARTASAGYPERRWRARYRDADGREHGRHVARKVDAQEWLDTITTSLGILAYTGVRFGELAALRVDGLDLERRRAIIAESMAEVRGHAVFSSRRTTTPALCRSPGSWSTTSAR